MLRAEDLSKRSRHQLVNSHRAYPRAVAVFSDESVVTTVPEKSVCDAEDDCATAALVFRSANNQRRFIRKGGILDVAFASDGSAVVVQTSKAWTS